MVKPKFNNKLCNDKMTFEDCQIAVLRHAVDVTEEKQGIAKVNNADVKKMLTIVEDFIRKKKLICYGGTAINNILPKFAQFYKKDIQLPDYDFFSANPIDDSKELADIYYKNGYTDVEAKSGLHFGTFKVFVNFIPIADITFLHPEIYNSISKDVIKINGLHYAPPNFLRMSMYLELSRPDGDVSRWEKVLQRLSLLNKYHPLKVGNCDKINKSKKFSSELNTVLKNALIDNGVIFFGGYSTQLYSKYMPDNISDSVKNISNFDVLSEEPSHCADIIIGKLKDEGFKKVKIIHHEEIGEIIPEHYEITIDGNSHVFIYKPIACHSYNKIQVDGKEIHIATIETILSFYLAFLYTNISSYDKNRLLCLSKYLFDVIEKNKLTDRGILKRFTISCYGNQKSLEDIRSEKANKFKEFKDLQVDFTSKDYQMWFLKYVPGSSANIKSAPKKKNNKTKKRTATSVIKSKTRRNNLHDYLF
jgi:hypothetical protein